MYSVSNFKLLVDIQAEMDAIYQEYENLQQTVITPEMDLEIKQFFAHLTQHLERQGFDITTTNSLLTAQYKSGMIEISKYSKGSIGYIGINFNNYTEDTLVVSIDVNPPVADTTPALKPDGFFVSLEQMNKKLEEAKCLLKACNAPKFVYQNKNKEIFHSIDEVVKFYFK